MVVFFAYNGKKSFLNIKRKVPKLKILVEENFKVLYMLFAPSSSASSIPHKDLVVFYDKGFSVIHY